MRLISTLKASQRVRADLCSHADQEASLVLCCRCEWSVTFTLVIVICVFLLCHTPTALVLVYTGIYTTEKGSYNDTIILGIGNICNLLVVLNSALNVLLYTFSNETFRRRLSRMFSIHRQDRERIRGQDNIVVEEIAMNL